MPRLFRASLIALAATLAVPALAADLPEVKVSATNKTPDCATPGRLMAYLRARNPKLNARFDSVATEYMRLGEELGLRWDMAFFQMVLETGALSFTGIVRADQNNFAGLGAAGGGNRGERFADIQSGVKAHLQHLLMYAGDHIDTPVAERTRKVQEWGVLTEWQQSIKGPMTFSLLAQQWAPGTRGYVRDIATISDGFYNDFCNAPDPRPELVQEARAGRETGPATQVAAATASDPVSEGKTATNAAAALMPDAFASGTNKPADVAAFVPEPFTGDGKTPVTVAAAGADAPLADSKKVSGAEIAQRAIEQARKEDPPRAGLGAAGMLGTVAAGAASATTMDEPQPAGKADVPSVTVLNAGKIDQPPTPAPDKLAAMPDKPTAVPDKPAQKAPGANKAPEIQTAAITGAATQMKLPASAKCKVWTASYGGQRAVLIKAATKDAVNYTVLDVNEVSEQREVDAYIAAYAKGGERIGAFPSQTKALDKAFELCPEG